jgi:hypothetical protein
MLAVWPQQESASLPKATAACSTDRAVRDCLNENVQNSLLAILLTVFRSLS